MNDFSDLLHNSHGPIRYRFTNDYMFRAVLQNSPEALKHLLSALLDIAYEDISSCEITNPIILGDTILDKDCILDIRLCINNKRLINLEMQTGNFTYWSNRALYYLSRMFCDLKSGEDYSQLKPATHIGILTESPFSDTKSFYSEYYMMDSKTGHIFSRNFSARVLDLSQIYQVPEGEQQTELYYWAKLFLAATWEEVAALSNLNPYLTEAASHLRKLSEDEKIQQQCEMREKYAMDMSCQKNEGIEIGRTEGIEIGRTEGIEIGRTQGVEIGRIQGVETERRESVLKILQKYGEVPADLKEHLSREKNLEMLNSWFDKALEVRSVDEFRKQIGI